MAFTPPTGPVIDEPLRPRALWYWIGGGLMAAGAIGAVIWLVTGITGLDDTVDDFERVPYPAGGTITIDEPGEYVIYTESFSGDLVVTGALLVDPDGEEVDTDVYVSELTYDFGGRAGSASETFTAEQAGDYDLSVTGADSTSISSLAVGRSIAGDLVATIVGAFVIGGLGFLIGGIIVIVTAVRRSRDKRARRPTPPPPTTWGQAPPTWGPQQPQAGWGQPQSGAPPPPPSGGSAPPPPPRWPS